MQQAIFPMVLAGFLAAFLAALALVGFLLHAYLRLQQAYRELSEVTRQYRNDLVGLCGASVGIDRCLDDHEQRIQECWQELTAIRDARDSARPYQKAIDCVLHGATAEELVEQCELSPSEADLLVRLHRAGGTEGRAVRP